MTPLLQVGDVTLSYGGAPVVRNCSIKVGEGEAYALIGTNGSGKSSLLRAVSGLLRPLSGRILINGDDVTHESPGRIVRRGIAHVPEGRHVLPEMSVLDNLLVGASPVWRKRARVQELLERGFEAFPVLKDRTQQMAGTLSGGEQQQLVLARGLMSDPRLLIVDEPSLGLAPVVVRVVAERLTALNETGLTLLVIEQNAEFALSLCERGAVMSNGELVAEGSSAELGETVRQAYLGG
jgi:branched-chain amino acid transport system ATP-binding protein